MPRVTPRSRVSTPATALPDRAIARRPRMLPWLGKAIGQLLHGAGATAAALMKPHRASLARLADIPLTAAGVALSDVGVFRAAAVAGFIVTGLSLVLVEHLIADAE